MEYAAPSAVGTGMKIKCFTNLDNYKREKWPTELPAKPAVGERMTSEGRRELKVCSLRWDFDGTLIVELHRGGPF